MTAKYLRPEDYDRGSHWITLKNLQNVIGEIPDPENITFETNDLSDINVFRNKVCLGYIELRDGDGKFVSFLPTYQDI